MPSATASLTTLSGLGCRRRQKLNLMASRVDAVTTLITESHIFLCGVAKLVSLIAGPIVWYQRFEYALGHWMQKSTEHVIGCVLCSPGCFSLFRGAALMDDNVMARYTTDATEPMQFIQYDQGLRSTLFHIDVRYSTA